MIQELLQPAFLKRRTADLADVLQTHTKQFSELTPELRQTAKKEGVTAASGRSSDGETSAYAEYVGWRPGASRRDGATQ
jgi:hypothetical protein